MEIYIVSKVTDSTDPETTTVGAYVDKDKANEVAKGIAGRVTVNETLQGITYGVVEPIELDLVGISQEALDALREVIG